MQCMLGLKSSPTQALWWLIILASSYPPLKRFINRFCHGFASFDGLEGGQQWLNTRHCRLAHKDGSLQTSQGHHQCPRPGRGHYWHASETPQAPRLWKIDWQEYTFRLSKTKQKSNYVADSGQYVHLLTYLFWLWRSTLTRRRKDQGDSRLHGWDMNKEWVQRMIAR